MERDGDLMAAVLIVDDDPITRSLLRDIMTTEGYVAQAAAHGDTALECLRTSGEPMVIVLNLMTPYLHNRGVLEAIAADSTLASRHPVVLLAGELVATQFGQLAELRERLRIHVVGMPLTVEQILDAVAALVPRVEV